MYNSILPTVISFNFHVIVHTALHDRAGTTASNKYLVVFSPLKTWTAINN